MGVGFGGVEDIVVFEGERKTAAEDQGIGNVDSQIPWSGREQIRMDAGLAAKW